MAHRPARPWVSRYECGVGSCGRTADGLVPRRPLRRSGCRSVGRSAKPLRVCTPVARRGHGRGGRSHQSRPAGPPGGTRLGLDPRLGRRDDGGGGRTLCELHLHLGAAARSRWTVGSAPPLTAAFRPVSFGSTGSALVVHRVLPSTPRTRAHGARANRATRLWARALHRIEHAPTDERWPASTFNADFAHGVELYRANVRGRILHPEARHTDVPVQLVIPLRDRYVTSALLDGLEDWTSELRRRPVDAGHWVIRTNPDIVVASIREFVAYVDRHAASRR